MDQILIFLIGLPIALLLGRLVGGLVAYTIIFIYEKYKRAKRAAAKKGAKT